MVLHRVLQNAFVCCCRCDIVCAVLYGAGVPVSDLQCQPLRLLPCPSWQSLFCPIRLSCEESIIGSRHAIALHHYCPSSPPSSLTHVGMTNKEQRGPRLYQVAPVPLKRIKSAADLKYTWDGLGIYDEEDLNEVRHHFQVLF